MSLCQTGLRLGQLRVTGAGGKLAQQITLFHKRAFADRFGHHQTGRFRGNCHLTRGLGTAPQNNGAVDGFGVASHGDDADGVYRIYGLCRLILCRNLCECQQGLTLKHQGIKSQ